MIQPFTPEPIRYVDPDGTLTRPLPEQYTPERLRELHAMMLRAREFDRKLITLLRQGRSTFYAQASGMEATQVGLARSVRPAHDWVWPYYRDHVLGMALGVPIVSTAVMGTATVLRGARSAVVSEENVEAFAGHVAEVLRSPQLRAQLSAAGPLDARAWSTEGLMEQVVALYQRLAQARVVAGSSDAHPAEATR